MYHENVYFSLFSLMLLINAFEGADYQRNSRDTGWNCDRKIVQLACSLQHDKICKSRCENGRCYCDPITGSNVDPPKRPPGMPVRNIISKVQNYLKTNIAEMNTDYTSRSKLSNQMDNDVDPTRGRRQGVVLRHHIAHFCPNLKLARQCIRGCMELGKPAFCGKDHVCYCGHQYLDTEDKPANVDDVYAQFSDLYEKYFGPNIEERK